MKESKTVANKVNKNRPEKDLQAQEMVRDEVAMMCWENLEEYLEEKPNRETSGQDERPDGDEEKQKYDEAQEEHVNCKLNTGN